MKDVVGTWTLYGFQEKVEFLQTAAIREIERDPYGFDTRRNGLNHSSRLLGEELIRGMARQLIKWCLEHGLYIIDVWEPWTRIATQRLRHGQVIFPRPGTTGLLMPLTHTPVKVAMVPHGGGQGNELEWFPTRLIQLLNVGARLAGSGNGTLRFVYLTYHVGDPLDHFRFSPPRDAAIRSLRRLMEKKYPWEWEDLEGRPTTVPDEDGTFPAHAPIIDRSSEVFFQGYRPLPEARWVLPRPLPMEPCTSYKAITYGPYHQPHAPTYLPHERIKDDIW